MAMRLLQRHFNLRGRTVLLRNDCDQVIALRKGSASPQLQEAEEMMYREAVATETRIFCLHVPGTVLISEGVDGGSREGAERFAGPLVHPWARDQIAKLLAENRWKLTLDLFAAGSNKHCDRYVSWTEEPDSEQVDAFTLRSWAQSRCIGCGDYHRETLLIFPPRGMERAVARRAKSRSWKLIPGYL